MELESIKRMYWNEKNLAKALGNINFPTYTQWLEMRLQKASATEAKEPKERKCRACDGRGWSNGPGGHNEYQLECNKCNGTGKAEPEKGAG